MNIRKQGLTTPVSSVSRKKTGRMTVSSRVILAILSAGMLLAFVFPLWNIWLDAPQYPEGLKLNIWLTKITGALPIINELNHYIGMQKIVPESIPELRYMPYIIGALIAFGAVAAITGKKAVLYAFAVTIVVVGVIGTVDFYMWEYDYGHNLDPRAAINIPGMSYQPPVIGSKQLLNFVATSWPSIGGITVIAAALGSIILSIYEWRRKHLKIDAQKRGTAKDAIHHALRHNGQYKTPAARLSA
jgi:copper chaperone NosL